MMLACDTAVARDGIMQCTELAWSLGVPPKSGDNLAERRWGKGQVPPRVLSPPREAGKNTPSKLTLNIAVEVNSSLGELQGCILLLEMQPALCS